MKPRGPLLLLLLPALGIFSYLGAYVAARATHDLVRCDGIGIRGPDFMRSNAGVTTSQVIYAPLIHVEEAFWRARGRL